MANKDNQLPEIHDNALEKAFARIVSPFEEFIHRETTGGYLLMACTVIALLVVNLGFNNAYQHILHTPVTFALGSWTLEKTVHHWINDGLMALFFFVVGLEIKREVLVGELSDIRQASLPIVAAIGGMIVPALIFSAINHGTEASDGWGIPMATDIAFAVGVMVLLGGRVPKALMTFIVALAIVDDLGAVVVIALFYTDTIHTGALMTALVLFGVLMLMNVLGFRKPLPYFVIGGLLWLAMLKSGIHATLAGVLTALAIPAGSKFSPEKFSGMVRGLLNKFDQHHRPNVSIMNNSEQGALLRTFERGVHLVETPLQRLEHTLHTPVAFLIIPLFALANAGIPIELSSVGSTLTHPVAIGIMVGLIVGKFAGIAGFSYLAIKLNFGSLPAGVNFTHIAGASLLAGIGFTMSIFITELAFPGQEEHLLMAKTGILFASLFAGIGGYIWLYLAGNGRDSSPNTPK